MFGILRTLLAFNVVLLHVFNVPTLGNFSVSFFFILSGFLMTLIMHESYSYDIGGVLFFWKNRILRLYPVYFIIVFVTIIVLIVGSDIVKHPDLFLPNTLREWLANISMIYPNIVPHRFGPRLSPPSWALTNELVFYCLISIGISKTKQITLLWFLLSIAYFVLTYIYYDIATYRYSSILASSLPFALGAMLYWVVKKYPLKTVSLTKVFILYLLFLLNAIFSSRLNILLRDFSIYINMLLAALIIYYLFYLKKENSMKKTDNYVGMYSYPFYLSHYLVLMMYTLITAYGITDNSFKIELKAIPFYFVFLLLFNFLLVHLVEMRVNKYKLKLKNKNI